MYFKYGDFRHDSHEASTSWGRKYQYAEDGQLEYVTETVAVSGKLQAESAEAITTLVRRFEAAYAKPNQTAGLYLASGQPTAHRWLQDQYDFIRLADGPNYTDEAGVYVTWRNYALVLEARRRPKPSEGANKILQWEQSIEIQGSGGPDVMFQQVVNGVWPEQAVAAVTPIVVVQSGSAVGGDGYVAYPEPIAPDRERGKLRRLWRGTPKQRTPKPYGFPCRWSYTMEFMGNPTIPSPGFPQ